MKWTYYPGVSAEDRMLKNDMYWEEEYQRMKRAELDGRSLPRSWKICPECGWYGLTNLMLCARRSCHTERVKLNIVPADKVEVLQR